MTAIPAWVRPGALVVASGGARYTTATDASARTVAYLAADWLVEEGWATKGPVPWGGAGYWISPTEALRAALGRAAA